MDMLIIHFGAEGEAQTYCNLPKSVGEATNFLITCNSDEERKLVEDFIDGLQEIEIAKYKAEA